MQSTLKRELKVHETVGEVKRWVGRHLGRRLKFLWLSAVIVGRL